MEYSGGVLFLRWTYGELFTDLSHSRMLHWQVLAIGRKGPETGYSVDVSLSLRPSGSAYTGGRCVQVVAASVVAGEP